MRYIKTHFIIYPFSSKKAKHMTVAQCIETCRYGQDGLLKLKLSIGMGTYGDLSDF